MNAHSVLDRPRAHQPNALEQVVYVCSAARCGSTFTDMFLGGHSRIASLGEVNFLQQVLRLGQRCTCGAVLLECPVWREVLNDLAQRWGHGLESLAENVGLWPVRYRKPAARHLRGAGSRLAFVLQRIRLLARETSPKCVRPFIPLGKSLELALRRKIDLYEAVARSLGRPVVVDSSKNAIEAIQLARRFPHLVRVIVLSRDGRGVLCSRLRSGIKPERAIVDWKVYYTRSLKLIEENVPAAHLLKLRYEDLATSPEDSGRDLCDWLGLRYESGMIEFATHVRHLISGNDSRFRPGADIKLDERWKHDLSDRQLKWFESTAGKINTALGYAGPTAVRHEVN